jgi:hypothetical protein
MDLSAVASQTSPGIFTEPQPSQTPINSTNKFFIHNLRFQLQFHWTIKFLLSYYGLGCETLMPLQRGFQTAPCRRRLLATLICITGYVHKTGIVTIPAHGQPRRSFPKHLPRTMEDHKYPHSTDTAPSGGNVTELELGGTFIDAPSPGELRIRRDTWVRIDLASGTILEISTSQAGPSNVGRLSIKLPSEMVVVPGFIDCVCIPLGGRVISYRLIGWW